MDRRIIIVLVGMACFLSGCGSYYYGKGKSLNECREDCRECVAELKKFRDPNAAEDPARYNIAYNYEGKFIDTCMKERGYKIVMQGSLPLRVKREDPDFWIYTDRGLAGTIDGN